LRRELPTRWTPNQTTGCYPGRRRLDDWSVAKGKRSVSNQLYVAPSQRSAADTEYMHTYIHMHKLTTHLES